VTASHALSDVEMHTWTVYRDVYVALASVLSEQLVDNSGLSASEFGVLNNLPGDPRRGMRIRDVCNVLGWDWSRVSHLVIRMEKRGLVTRHPCDDDGRGTEVRVTSTGRAAVDDAAPKHWDAVRRYFLDALSPKEHATFTRLLERIQDNLVEHRP
jgi:DNA-binding MarR family transcriptional regulator